MVQLKSSKSEHVQLKGQSPREGAVPSRTRCFLEDERPDKLNTFFNKPKLYCKKLFKKDIKKAGNKIPKYLGNIIIVMISLFDKKGIPSSM